MKDSQVPYWTHRIRIYILTRFPCDLYPHPNQGMSTLLHTGPDTWSQLSDISIANHLQAMSQIPIHFPKHNSEIIFSMKMFPIPACSSLPEYCAVFSAFQGKERFYCLPLFTLYQNPVSFPYETKILILRVPSALSRANASARETFE